MDLRLLDTWARRHHGLVSIDAALGLGISRDAWKRAVRSGRIELVQPRVARLPGAPPSDLQPIAAAVLAAGAGAIASHRSAARLWGIERPRIDPVDVTLPRRRKTPVLWNVVVHRPTDRRDLSVVERSGLPTTNPLRTVADCAAVDPAGTAEMVEHLVVNGFARPSALRELVRRHALPGRTGQTALRAAVDAWPLGDKPADSVLEPAMARLLAAHRLPAAEFHARIEGFEVDFLLIGTPIVIECDGWEFHVKDKVTFAADRARDAVLSAAGYVVVRVTWEHVTRRPDEPARRIAAVVRRWAPDALVA